MTYFKKVCATVLLAPALLIGSAFAAEPGFYIGASGGQSFIDDEYTDNIKVDDDETGWKAYLGYQFLPWLGVEAGYVDFGSYSSNNLFQNTNFDADLDLSAWQGFLVGTLPLGPVDLFAKVGAADLKAEIDTQNFGTESDNDTQFAYGVGAAYNFGDGHWGLRVEAEGYDDNEVDDFYFVSAGITYRFFSKPAPVVAAPVAAPAKCADADNDGVCDTEDQCPNTPAKTRVGVIGCDCDYTLTLEFAFDSAVLSPSDTAQLDKLIPVLNDAKAGFIGGVIEGHTDSTGSEDYNMGLSQRRANSVASYLQSQGVNLGGRFETEAYGESNPIASNDTEAGRAENRRVVIRRTDCNSTSSR